MQLYLHRSYYSSDEVQLSLQKNTLDVISTATEKRRHQPQSLQAKFYTRLTLKDILLEERLNRSLQKYKGR